MSCVKDCKCLGNGPVSPCIGLEFCFDSCLDGVLKLLSGSEGCFLTCPETWT